LTELNFARDDAHARIAQKQKAAGGKLAASMTTISGLV